LDCSFLALVRKKLPRSIQRRRLKGEKEKMKKLNLPPFSCKELEHRKEDCKNYSTCLELAMIKDWPDFSCENCENYEQEKISSTEYIFRTNSSFCEEQSFPKLSDLE